MAAAMLTADFQGLLVRSSVVTILMATYGCASAPLVVDVVTELPSIDERMSWILRLEDQRKLADDLPPPPPPPPPTAETDDLLLIIPPKPIPQPDLEVLAKSDEAYLRRRVALAVGRVGLSEGVEILLDLLDDPEMEVRRMAAFGLGLIGDVAATVPLSSALNDISPKVQGQAAQALARIGAVSAVEDIGSMVGRYVTAAFVVDPEDIGYPLDAEIEAFRLGVYALGDLKAFDQLAEAVLDDGGQPILWWWPVAYALGQTGDARALSALETLSGVQGSFGVSLAARGLGRLGDVRAIEPLEALLDLDRRDRNVVIAAVQALAEIDAPKAAAALDRFVRIRRLDQHLRLIAVNALSQQNSLASVEVFIELLDHPWAFLRAAAFRALARTDPDTFVLVLSGFSSDQDWRVRAAIADGLRWVPKEAAQYRLLLMLNDEDQRVVPSVLKSLVAVGSEDAARILRTRLTASDVVVRKTALRLLAEIRPEGAEQLFVEAYELALPDPSYVARAAALDALSQFDGELARDTLSKALTDRDWAVRLKADHHLERLSPGVSGNRIRPAPSLRQVNYESSDLVRPRVSPHAYIETVHGTIEIELAVVDAPLVSHNFMTLARQGFYDGLTFHRVIPNNVVQAGDPRSDNEGGPGYTIRDELNSRPFLPGTVGIARDWADTGGSQFFITYSPQPQLDARYTAFGHVVAGMEVLGSIEPGDVIERVLVWDGVQPFDRQPESSVRQ